MQTTYENFRYRYDKKENPYNIGLIKNFQEILFSRIPPSMLDFRAFVHEDEMMAAETTDDGRAEDITSSKEKIDIEMGNNFGEENSISLPELLLSIEFGGIHDNLKHKLDSETNDSDNLVFASNQEVKEFATTSTVEVKSNLEEKCNDMKSEHNTD